jgi:3-oxoacyl-ACP reductase-like protein
LGAAAESLSFWVRPDFWRGPCRRQNSNAAAAAAAATATAAATAAAAAAADAEQSSNESLEALDSHTFMTVCSTEGTVVSINILFTFNFLCQQIETSLKKLLLGFFCIAGQ